MQDLFSPIGRSVTSVSFQKGIVDDPKFEIFLKWLKDNGAEFDCVDMCSMGGSVPVSSLWFPIDARGVFESRYSARNQNHQNSKETHHVLRYGKRLRVVRQPARTKRRFREVQARLLRQFPPRRHGERGLLLQTLLRHTSGGHQQHPRDLDQPRDQPAPRLLFRIFRPPFLF